MAKYILCIGMLVVVTSAHRQLHLKLPPKTDNYSIAISNITGGYNEGEYGDGLQLWISESRLASFDTYDVWMWEKLIEKSRCGNPKDVFVHLDLNVTHEEVSPSAVWVKRCVGLCEYDNALSCVPTETVILHMPVRVYNAKTNKEICATYPVEEHVTCGCCTLGSDNCTPRVLVPSASVPTEAEGTNPLYNRPMCSCQRPSIEERRACFKPIKKSFNKLLLSMHCLHFACLLDDRYTSLILTLLSACS